MPTIILNSHEENFTVRSQITKILCHRNLELYIQYGSANICHSAICTITASGSSSFVLDDFICVIILCFQVDISFQDDVVSMVRSELNSSELIAITEIIKLLHAVVQDPWHSKNKMTAHTLGIACGLSLFPQLDPSKATVLTERLIIDYEILKQSHSLL